MAEESQQFNSFTCFHIGVARIFDWGAQTACNDVIRFKRVFCWGKDIVEWKIRSRGLVLAHN